MLSDEVIEQAKLTKAERESASAAAMTSVTNLFKYFEDMPETRLDMAEFVMASATYNEHIQKDRDELTDSAEIFDQCFLRAAVAALFILALQHERKGDHDNDH